MSQTWRVGDVGVPILIRCARDLSSFTTVALRLTKPDASTDSITCTLAEKGTLAIATTTAGDIDQAGEYTADLRVTGPGTIDFTMSAGTITVLA